MATRCTDLRDAQFDTTELIGAITAAHCHLVGSTRWVYLLIDLDSLSHVGSANGRCSDAQLMAGLNQLVTVAASFGRVRLRAACSTRTAFRHWQVLTTLPNNPWQPRVGVDGADRFVVDELEHLATRSTTGLVLLFGGDHAYASAVGAVVATGVPVWVVAREGSLARSLRNVATAVRLHADPSDHRPDSGAVVPDHPAGIGCIKFAPGGRSERIAVAQGKYSD